MDYAYAYISNFNGSFGSCDSDQIEKDQKKASRT